MTNAYPHDPKRIPPGDTWTWTCGICGLCTQGGRRGLQEHQRVVHPGESETP